MTPRIELLDTQPPEHVPGLRCPVCGVYDLQPCRLSEHMEPRAFSAYVRRQIVIDHILETRHAVACARRPS